MKTLEKILLISAIGTLTLKLFLVPYTAPLLLISILSLSLIYIPLGFAFFNQIEIKDLFKSASYKRISAKRVVSSTCFGILLSFIWIGIFFKSCLYPGGNMILIPHLLIAFIVLFFVFRKNDIDIFYSTVRNRILIIGGLGLIVAIFHQIPTI